MSTPMGEGLNARANSSVTHRYASSKTIDDHAPLWAFVTINEKGRRKGDNKSWTCNFCERPVKGSYSSVTTHLLRISSQRVFVCHKVNYECLADLERICEEAENILKPKNVSLPIDNRTPTAPTLLPKRRRMGTCNDGGNIQG